MALYGTVPPCIGSWRSPTDFMENPIHWKHFLNKNNVGFMENSVQLNDLEVPQWIGNLQIPVFYRHLPRCLVVNAFTATRVFKYGAM